MVISVLSGRGFPPQEALQWLDTQGSKYLKNGNIWRVAPEGAGIDLISELFKRGERLTCHLPSTIYWSPAKDQPLLNFLKKRNCLREIHAEYPRGDEYLSRNMRMITTSKLLVAFYDGREGALEKSIANAQRMKKKIIIVSREGE
jgi:hypothetical protein